MAEHDLAKFSAEQTAHFMGGGELGRPQWADPEMQKRQDEQRAKLRGALDLNIETFARALHELSPETETRLRALHSHAMAGNEDAIRMFLAMYGELVHQALTP